MAIERLRFDEQPERLPPHNGEAEEAILGSVLLDSEVIGRVSGALEARDFYRERNGVIYQCMLGLYARSEPVDYMTLIDELDRTQKIDQVGGVTYLTGLLGVVPTPIHADSYARIVANCALMRRLISAGGKIATIGFQNQLPPETALEKCEQILFEAVSSLRSERDFVSMPDALQEYLSRLTATEEEGGEAFGVPTGFPTIDNVVAGGLQRSNLIILAARPGLGKTSLALAIARQLGTQFKGTSAIFSLEMSRGELVARLLSMMARIESSRLKGSTLAPAELQRLGDAFGTLAECPIWIDDTPGISVTNLRAKARRLHAREPLDLIIVDHMQLMTAGSGNGMNRVQEMSEISRQLKGLARDLNVPVLAISQLSRAVEQRSPKIPQLSDLRESGSIEADADIVMFIYRDEVYDRDSERAGIADIYFAKNRNGPTPQVSLVFDQKTTTFLEMDRYRD